MWLFACLVEATLGFVVFSADSAVMDRPELRIRLIRGGLWPVTAWHWCTHRTFAKIGRAGMHVWLLVTMGWLLSLEHDRLKPTSVFAVTGWLTMAFIVWCVDSMSNDLLGQSVRRVARALLWPKPFGEYMRDPDTPRQTTAMLLIWFFLSIGWLIALGWERFGPTLVAWS